MDFISKDVIPAEAGIQRWRCLKKISIWTPAFAGVTILMLMANFALAEVSPRPITLDEAFALALKRSESLAVSEASVAEALARIDEIASAVKPEISFRASNQWQDAPDAGAGSTNSSFSQRSRPQVNLNAHQPLFSGFREFLAYKAAKRQGESARLDLQRAQDLLYQDVAQSYLNLLGMQKEIQIRLETQNISAERLKDLREWERIGRSRRSEVLAAQTQLAQLEADLSRARSREFQYEETLRFLTGLTDVLAPADVPFPAADPLETVLSQARARADVMAREKEYEAAKLATDVYRRQRWPTIAADGNYYFKRPSGFQETIEWDALLSLDFPLYTGGAIKSQVEQSRAREKIAEQNLSLARRRAEFEARTAARDLTFSLDTLQALEKAETLAQQNIRAQTADYRHGLVTNLEVLSTLASVQEIRLNLNEVKMTAAFDRARLAVAAGKVLP